MRRDLVLLLSCGLGLVSADAVADGEGSTGASRVVVSSPDGRVRADVFLDRPGENEDEAASRLRYRVWFRGRPVVLPSRLGLDLADGSRLGGRSIIEGASSRSIHEVYEQFPGKRSRVVDHCTETVISLRERSEPARRWDLVVRAANDGAAFRYRIPAQGGWSRLEVGGEQSEFRLPEDARAYALPLKSFTSSHEARYQNRPAAEIPNEWLLGLPLLAEVPQAGWVALTEANLTDHAGLYLAREGNEGASLVARLSPLPEEPKVAVRATLPHDTPWRVIMIGDDPKRLIESDLVLNLNEPNAIGDTSWIRPGKTTFPWWNGFYERQVPFKPDLNTATAKYYIDFCAEAGIPYHSLDGIENRAWYGGPIRPYQGAGITAGAEGLDFPEVIRYAESKGVRLRLWMHWQAAEKHMDKAFPLYRKWGIEGVMLDFMDRDDQEMVKFLRRALKTAADNHLTVTLHGVGQPTGLERTFPNLLTSEAVLNLEYGKFDKLGVPPSHELVVPFTRMLAGPLDFHQGSLRGVPVAEWVMRNEAPLVMGTPCRMLASYVVYQNHLPMVADYPSAYRGHPALPVLAKIPVTWDETRCVAGAVGQSIVIARRHGDEWWVGGMTDEQARELEVPLGFLGAGRFRAVIYRDDLASKDRLADHSQDVGAGDTLKASLAPAGGVLIRLTPLARDAKP